MKRIIIVLGMLATMSAYAQDEKSCRIVKDSYDELRIEFAIDKPTVGETSICGEQFSTLTLDGYLPSTLEGSPNLPIFSRLIEVPLCDDFKVSVTDAVYDTLGPVEHWVAPVQPSRRKSDTSVAKLLISREVYSQNAFIGNEEALVEAVGIARDRRLARLQFSPVRYNPVSGQIIVCRKATVSVSYSNADVEGTKELFNRYYSPAFKSGANTLNSLYPKSVSSAAPVRYLIVANSMFRGQLDTFVNWKKRKGFLTDIVYTDEAAVGTTTSSIQAYLQSQYTNATTTNPAPTFVLLVGDVAQIPAFNGTAYADPHVTDLYYCTWTSGDNVPDCHYGRFSAQTQEQLLPQIQKTLMYEQYTFADPSFLDRAVMVAGIDRGYSSDHGYTHGDPALDYGITNYINGAHGFSNVYYFKNNTSIVPQGVTNVTVNSNATSNAATIRNYYNQGAGFINYTAHGSSAGWYSPSFETSHVASMSNTQKFGLMIGNCCQTSMFGESECFAEALLRKGNYCGAVGYIGGSESTYWDEDFYWAVGVRSTINANISMAYNANNLGVYDRSFHTHNEAFSEWATSQGSLIYYGNMAVQSSGSNKTLYYWEIYHLMGDPSVMTYLTQASIMNFAAASTIPYGTTSISVTAAPYSYVALTDTTTHTLMAAAWADASGQVMLNISNSIPVGTYELVASAQQYRVAFRTLNIIAPTGAFPSVTDIIATSPLVPGDTVTLNVTVENLGNVTADSVNVSLTASSSALTLLNNTATINSLAVGAQHTFSSVRAVVNPAASDLTAVNITATANWNGGSTPSTSIYPQTIVAPIPMVSYSVPAAKMLPGNSTTVTATLYNRGHADMHNWQLDVQSPTQKINVSYASTTGSLLGAGDSVSATINIAADTDLPLDVSLPLSIVVPYAFTNHSAATQYADTLEVILANTLCETFEGNQYHLSGWSQGTTPWSINNSGAHNGNYCASSTNAGTANSTAAISISCTITKADSISFYYKVSSESGWDKFHFYLDNADKITASGEVDWTRAAFPVSAGTHTFRFTYEKDNSVNRGSDRAWIDDVVIPHDIHNATFSQLDICANDSAAHPSYIVNPDASVVIYDYTIHPLQHILDTVVDYPQAPFTWNDIDYTVNGDYTQYFTDIYGCDSTVTLHLTFATQGITTTDGVTLKLYPNPTADLLHLDGDVDEALVYDVNGRLVATEKNTRLIDMTALPAGVYTLRLTLPTGSATCRVIKK